MKPTLAIYGIKDRYAQKYPVYTHDHNLCLMQDGKVVQYLQLERYTRKKYDNRLHLFLEELVDQKLLTLPKEFDLVSVNSFVGNAFLSKNGRIRLEAPLENELQEKLTPASAWYQHNDRDGRPLKAYNCSQELAHIASCLPFFGNFKENSLLVHFDGGASLGNFSAWHFNNGQLKKLECHWELSKLSKFFNDNAFVFKVLGASPNDHCSVPGKLMGYASLGQYTAEMEEWLEKNHYFSKTWNNPHAILSAVNERFGLKLENFDNTNKFFQNVASTLQYIFERELLTKMQFLQESIKADYLYYTGGCALNIVANTKIIRQNWFKDVFIPPACNDSGLSLGAASYLEFKKGNEIQTHSPYLNSVGIENVSVKTFDEDLIKNVAKILLDKGIVGVCNGYAEAGPRALGNRSLIALPNCKDLSRKLSMIVKKREWYRPVAPIMLKKIADQVTHDKVHHLARYMLLDFNIKEEYKNSLCGVVHINGTSRIQTLEKTEDNPFMYSLLSFLHKEHSILALINTSFNAQGEPIVHTAEDAHRSAGIMGIDAVVINNDLKILN